MGEGVGTDDGLGPLGLHTGEASDEAAGGDDLSRVHVNVEIEVGAASADRHDDVFGGGVAGALAQAVEAGIYALSAVAEAGEGVGDGEAEVVVAVGGDVDVGELALDVGDELAELPGQGEANGVAEGDEAHAFGADGADDFEDEVVLGAGGVFEGEVYVGGVLAAAGNGGARHLQHFVASLAELDLAVERRGAEIGRASCRERV